jgi:hypothetical protein
MDDKQLNEIATLFEVEAADAKTHIERCKPQHLVGLTANRAGFLRLAASCLRAAAEPLNEEDCRSKPLQILEPHEQVVDNDSDCIICFLQRMEVWPEPKEFIEARKKRTQKYDRWAILTCGVVGFIVLFVIVAGISAIATWLR